MIFPSLGIVTGVFLLWFSTDLNEIHQLDIFNIIIGVSIILLEFVRNYNPNLCRMAWAFIAVCLLLLPLVFWTPSGDEYTVNTFVGIILFFFAGIRSAEMNKSFLFSRQHTRSFDWKKRLPVIMLAVFCFSITHYLSTYRLGHIADVWEPFFNPGAPAVLTSSFSQLFPISLSGLASVVFLIQAFLAFAGNSSRWERLSWLALGFGFVTITVNLTGFAFVVLQAVFIKTWCTLCLLTFFLGLFTIPFALSEIKLAINWIKRPTHPDTLI